MSKLRIMLFMIAASALFACSSEPKVVEFANSADPQVELDRVSRNIDRAKEGQVEILSPKNFERSKKYWTQAVNERSSNKDQKTILHSIAVSQAYLDKANAVSDVSHQLVEGAIVARRDAMVSNAAANFPSEMGAADKRFRNLNEEIENNDTSSAATKSPQIEQTFRNIELSSIKKERLGPALENMKQAMNEGAEKLTPETLAWAQKQIANDEVLITNDRHNVSVVNKASMNANQSANRLMKMVRSAKNSTNNKPEDFAKIAEKNELAMNSSKQQLNRTENALENSENKLVKAVSQNEKLESEAWLNNEFELASAQFTKDEAEVYKQGDKLLLRLKGLSFTNNKSVIGSENFKLLAKVQKVISDVGGTQIVIEGHTDSTGGQKLNDALSMQRAESVQSYLIANKDITPDKIKATGFGDRKPLASNKTVSGRAQNRRVDIIITAEPNIE
jgi:OOP family OmpA-OmpF porin